MAKRKRTTKKPAPAEVELAPKLVRRPGPNGERLYELESAKFELETRLTTLTHQLKNAQARLKSTSKQVVEVTKDIASGQPAAKRTGKTTTPERLKELESKQAEHETQIDGLTRELRTAQASLQSTNAQIAQLTNALAPVTRVSDEILQAIFRYGCSHAEKDTEWLHNMPPRLLFLIRLTQVTSRWRTTAINDPLLWSHIDLHFALSTELLDLQLQRSQSAPLDIVFDFGSRTPESPWTTESSEESSEEFCEVYLPIILPTLPRWRTLSFRSLGFRPTLAVFRRLRPLAAPALECIAVETGDMHNVDDGEDLDAVVYPDHKDYKVFTRGAPRLTAIHVHNLEFPAFFEPPVGNIRTFRFTGNVRMSCKMFRKAVKPMVKLRELIIGPNVVKLEKGEDNVVVVPTVVSVKKAGHNVWDYDDDDGLQWIIRGAKDIESVMPSRRKA
ncbi:hypothetical protein Hypma_007350 [Hypsizygus marmoreus]|uniref:Uncharacterized protein n=1 Tax=Hypsizygus marmoreus TaxID=39966 RepID=A0A369K078_HYPMA|nr:hypothetical protein Hypma_007350 [Hypsizygus marmoreus]